MLKTALALSLAALAGFASCIPALAKPQVLPGYVAKDNIQQVNEGIKWHTSLPEAESEARRQGKMVLWIQMLGKMDGAT